MISCSAEQAYKSIQMSKIQECQRLPLPRQPPCLELYDMDYDQYRRETQPN
jgi:hypothetical protein